MKKLLLAAALSGLMTTTALSEPTEERLRVFNIGSAIGSLEICGGTLHKIEKPERVNNWMNTGQEAINIMKKIGRMDLINVMQSSRELAQKYAVFARFESIEDLNQQKGSFIEVKPDTADTHVIAGRCDEVSDWLRRNLSTGFLSRKSLQIPSTKVAPRKPTRSVREWSI